MKNLYHLFISILFLIIYRLGSFSKITFGDSAGKILDIELNKFNLETYSLSHFLYQNFTVLIYKILPFANSIEIGRWVNIISAIIVLNILFKILTLILKNNWISLLGTIGFGLSFTFWKNTENIEVYTFSLIWVSIYILLAVYYIKTLKTKFLLLLGIILGVSLFSHIQGILLLPSYFYLFYFASKNDIKIKSILIYLIIPILFLGLLYIYPIVNNESIKNVLSSSDNPWISNSLNKSFSNYVKDFTKALGYIIYNFWWINLGLIFIPFKTYLKNNIIHFLIILGLPVFTFSTIYDVSDNYVFFLNFNLAYLIICTIGLNHFIKKYPNYTKIISILIFITPLYYFTAKRLALITSVGKEFHQEKAYKDGLNYYLLPWMNNNKGVIEVILNNEETNDDIQWIKESVDQLIEIKSKTMTKEEIKNL